MRSTDEQLRLLKSRAAALRQKRQRRARLGVTAAACLALVAALSSLLSLEGGTVLMQGDAAFGSMILLSPRLGTIVVAILAFALGVGVTLLCVGCRKQRGEKENDRDC